MIRLKNRFGKANRKEMSWMSDLMETLRQEGISPDLLRAVEEYRAAHALPLLFRGCGVSCKASLVYDTLLSLVNGQSARFAEKRLLSCIWGRMPSRPVQQKRAPAPAGADAL